MSTKQKRTCTISHEAVATVKRLVDEWHPAPSHDAPVERAIAELARRVRDADNARLWQAAGAGAGFAESDQLDAESTDDDLRIRGS